MAEALGLAAGGARDLLHRRHAIGEMRPIKIDVIGLQAFQTPFDRANHVFAAVAGARDTVGGSRTQGIFRGKNKIIAIRGDEVADQFLGLAKLITVRRVDKVAVGLDVSIKNLFRFAALGAITPAGGEVAGA